MNLIYSGGEPGVWFGPYSGSPPEAVNLPFQKGPDYIENIENFLGAKMYEPQLEFIYLGLGITGVAQDE